MSKVLAIDTELLIHDTESRWVSLPDIAEDGIRIIISIEKLYCN